MKSYYAHTDPRPNVGLPDRNGAIWQTLREHLCRVAHRARLLARNARPNDQEFAAAAMWAGLLHDLGKYSPEFQDRLRKLALGEKAGEAPHAVYGAAWAHQVRAWDLAWAIMGHHAGLHAQRELTGKIGELAADKLEAILASARGDDELGRLLAHTPPRNTVPIVAKAADRVWELRLRMLFSVLVDADRLDCQRFEQRVLGEAGELAGPPLAAAGMYEALKRFIGEKAKAAPEGSVKRCRAEILQACLEAADRPGRLFSLCVPTGGGKTLASMAFALKRAVERPDEVRRIIVVIPFLSVIEQNASVLAEAFKALGPGAVLEHHSGDCGESGRESAGEEQEDASNLAAMRRRRLMTENWDAPVIVTTSVRFFDSLFSNRPADLRRVHNIARSVVILDEVQTLPRELLAPLITMMKGLAEQWDTTFVFCTATQPAFEKNEDSDEDDPRWEPGSIQPIIPQELEKSLFHDLRRVINPVWPSEENRITWSELAKLLLVEEQVLCIVNTKRQARELYHEMIRQGGEEMTDVIIHLSTLMCPEHRLKLIRTIKQRVDAGLPCIVISTQLVEAGVDLSFPVVFRAMGPLDAIVQAAGRCDREGKLTSKHGYPYGRLVIYEPIDDATPYRDATDITRMMTKMVDLSIHERNHMQLYFNMYYQEANLDRNLIEGFRANCDYPAVNHRFHMISEVTTPVLVHYDSQSEDLIERLRSERKIGKAEWRALQRYQVGLRPAKPHQRRWAEFEQARRDGVILELWPGADIWESQKGCYSEAEGLLLGAINDPLIE